MVACIAACSSKHAPPATTTGSGAVQRSGSAASGSASAPAAMKPPLPPVALDLPAAGVTKLVVHPANDPASDVVADWNAKDRDATVVCRVEAYNLVAFDPHDPDGLGPGQHQLEWRSQPFVSSPKACEIRFVDHGKLLASACWHPGRLEPTACPGGDLPPPKRPEHVNALNIEGSTLRLSGKDVRIDALVTREAEMGPHETHFALRCDGAEAKTASDDTERVAAAGEYETVFATLLFTMPKPLTAPPKACELRVLVKHAGQKQPVVDGTFCIHEGSTEPGACES